MKISLTIDLTAPRNAAEALINNHFNGLMYANLHRNEAHRRKRSDAEQVIAGASEAPVSFQAEAKRVGVDVKDYAKLIVSKPDEFSRREDSRRELIDQIRAAKSAGEMKDILAKAKIQTEFTGI